MRTIVTVCALGLLGLGGCSMGPVVTRDAVDYLRAVQAYNEQQILQNILWAKDRRRMQFARVTAVRGSARTTANISGKLPIGGAAVDDYSLGPSASFVRGPDFDFTPLDSKEFIAGFHRPISPVVLGELLDRGWPEALLLPLAVSSVSSEQGVFRNDPNNPTERDRFLDKLRGLMKSTDTSVCPMEPQRLPAYDENKPLYSTDIVERELEAQVTALGAGLELQRVIKADGDGFQIARAVAPKYRIESTQCGKGRKNGKAADSELESAGGTNDGLFVFAADADGRTARKGQPKAPAMRLRSPRDMLYFLGEIVRGKELGQASYFVGPASACDAGTVELFRITREAEATGTAAVALAYDGAVWEVPPVSENGSAPNHRGLDAMALIGQLIGLQQADATGLRTQTVRLFP